MALSLPLSTEKLIQLWRSALPTFPAMNLDEITQQIERDATDFTTPIGQINYAISLSDFLEKVLKKTPVLFSSMVANTSSIFRLSTLC